MKGLSVAAVGIALALALEVSPLEAAVVHLKNGSQLTVDAWREIGDEIEVSMGGGLIRIPRSDVDRVEGGPASRDLRMSVGLREGVVRRAFGLLDEAERTMRTTSLTPNDKFERFSRLRLSWGVLVRDALGCCGQSLPAQLHNSGGVLDWAEALVLQGITEDQHPEMLEWLERVRDARRQIEAMELLTR